MEAAVKSQKHPVKGVWQKQGLVEKLFHNKAFP